MSGAGPRFADRREAGRLLADAIKPLGLLDPVVVALPRGGVPVAFEIARALGAPLELLIVRKLGAPGQAEFGIGAVAGGHDPQLVLNDEAIRILDPPATYIEAERVRQLAEIERRERAYRGETLPLPLGGRTVVLVDDGIATGGTVRVALRALRRMGVASVLLAVPVAPPDTLAALKGETDGILCLLAPNPFVAVGLHYRDFEQTSDGEVTGLLAAARAAPAARVGRD